MLGPEAYSSAQTAIIVLLEISCLVRQIGTAVTPLFTEASGVCSRFIYSLANIQEKTILGTTPCI